MAIAGCCRLACVLRVELVLWLDKMPTKAPRIQTLEIDDGWAATKDVVVGCSLVPQRVLGEEKSGLVVARKEEVKWKRGDDDTSSSQEQVEPSKQDD